MPKHLLSFFLVISCAAFLYSADYSDSQEKVFEVQGKPQLVLQNSDGVIEISQHSGSEVKIKVIKQVRGVKNDAEGKKEADRISIELIQNGNLIRATTHWPRSHVIHWGGSVDVRYEIQTPRQSDIEADVSDGELRVNGIEGTLQLRSSDGDVIAADLAGQLKLSTSDGNIELKRASGTMEFRLSDGDLLAEDCSGSLRISSGDGNLVLSRFHGDLDISNTDGDVRVDGLLTSLNGRISDGSMTIALSTGSKMANDWSLRSADGDIVLDLPDDFSANLDLSASDGDIHTNFPVSVTGALSSNRVSGKIRDGGYLLKIKTTDGRISLH